MTQSRMDTRPDERDVTEPTLGPVGMLRWAWRQLTSMRTALFLLLMLAIGAVPGSIWPQRNIDAGRVADYLASHRSTGPWLDRLGFFDVYSSPWFAAIYLLLFSRACGQPCSCCGCGRVELCRVRSGHSAISMQDELRTTCRATAVPVRGSPGSPQLVL